jgi:glutamate--cysteine ligase
MMRHDESNAYRPYGAWASEGASTIERWETHLSTLFPEVRPRGHLELRSMDAIAPRWLAAPIVVVCGLVYDRESACAAREMLDSADEDTLSLAARCGLRAPSIGTTAADLYALGIEGARRLGESYVSPSDLDVALDFHERYTRVGLSPADER